MGKRTRSAETKPRLNRAAGLALVDQWRRSGLSAAAFSQKEGLGSHVLRYWASQAKKQRPSSKDFFVVSSGPKPCGETTPTSPATHTGAFELRVNGIVVVVPLSAGHAAFTETLRLVLEEVGA